MTVETNEMLKEERISRSSFLWLLYGIGFTLIIALLGYGLAAVPGFQRIGPLASAILIAIVYRQIWDYPERLRPGIEFSAKKLLRLAIILYGLKLNMAVIFQEGLPLLVRDTATIAVAIGLMLVLAKWLQADWKMSLLLGVGTGVCGAAAIAAAAPILKAKDEDTAVSVGMIALIGTIFALVYTLLLPVLSLSAEDYGIWSGISLHEMAHVALAAEPAGEDALAMALLAKLGRVFLLIPLCFILMFWMRRKTSVNENSQAKIDIPWFLLGFVAMSLLGSYVFGEYVHVSPAVMAGISNVSTFILTMAMVGLGLNVRFQSLGRRALRPLLALGLTSVLLSVLTLISL